MGEQKWRRGSGSKSTRDFEKQASSIYVGSDKGKRHHFRADNLPPDNGRSIGQKQQGIIVY